MIGKRAKILSPDHVEDLLVFAKQTRNPIRNQALVLLSVKADLRAGEIANLTWPMVAEASGEVGMSMELQDNAAKKGSGRVIPIHPELRAALVKLARLGPRPSGPVIRSERGGPMTPVSIVCWFAKAFKTIDLNGCSSHSGRRTWRIRRRDPANVWPSCRRSSAAGRCSVLSPLSAHEMPMKYVNKSGQKGKIEAEYYGNH
jgi:integrase